MRLDALVHSRKLQITKKCAKSETKKSKGKFLLTRRYSILSQYSSLLMRYTPFGVQDCWYIDPLG